MAAAAAALCVALAGPGCYHVDNDEETKAVTAGEKPVAMEGSGSFFDGKMGVKVTLSRGVGHGLKKTGREKGDYTYQEFANNENKAMLGSPLPPVTIHLILTNSSPSPMTVTVVDFVSDMGNFAVDPETLTIGPGQTAEPTPMVSDLGVNSDSMPFKVTLKYGIDKDSHTFPVSIVHRDAAEPDAK